jgi:hypothetical protein
VSTPSTDSALAAGPGRARGRWPREADDARIALGPPRQKTPGTAGTDGRG